MIKIEFKTNEKTGLVSLKIKGHAECGEKGEDIICASASILTYTIAQVISAIDKQGGLKKPPIIKLKEGNSTVNCYPKKEFRNKVIDAYSVVYAGYMLLEYNFGDYVSVSDC